MRAVIVGASGGIGGALATALVEAGARVHALSRSTGFEITDEASIAATAATIAREGPLDLVIVATGLLHGAGIAPEKTFRQLSADALAAYFAVNTIGPALVAKHFLPLMHRRERAVFAALSARVGSIGDNRLGGWYGYRASKAALNMMVRSLAIELARTRPATICVGVHPGTVATDLSAPFQAGVADGTLFTPARAAWHILNVLAQLTPPDSGGCFAWDNTRIAP